MHSALKPILRAALFYLLSVLAIAGVLVAGGYLVDAVKGAVGARERLALLTGVQQELARYRQDGGAALQARLAAACELPLAALDERIRGVSAELAAQTAHAADERGELAILLDAGPERYATGLAARYRPGWRRRSCSRNSLTCKACAASSWPCKAARPQPAS